MKAYVLVILALLVQLPESPQTTGSIEGLILGSGDQPLAGAEVKAWWEVPPASYRPDEVPRATTGSDGRFVIQNVNPGKYRIVATAAGYVIQGFGADRPGRVASNAGTVISVGSRQTTQGITVRLVADSIISGRITSASGEPLVRMEVRAARRVFDESGSSSWSIDGTAQTNDRGEYRIAGIAPGRYFVFGASIPEGIIELERRRAVSERSADPVLPTPGLFPPTFYPGTADSSKATSIEVQANVETRNIDFALLQPRRYTIRGRVRDPLNPELPARRGSSDSAVSITLFPTNIEFLSAIGPSAHASMSGYFEVADVIPGKYWVTAQMPPATVTAEQRQALALPGANISEIVTAPARGVAVVTVTESDVSNVEITIVRDFAVNGHVSIEGPTVSADAIARVKVELWAIDPTGQLGGPMGRSIMDSAGRFAISNLVPAEYRLKVRGLPPELYTKEARLGSIDALGESIPIVSEATASAEIVFAKGSEVSGTVTDATPKAISGREVVLVPEKGRNRADLYKVARTDSSGRFSFHGVAPGSYRAFAWEEVERFRYFDAEFIKQFEDRGTVVRVGDSSDTAIEVKLIPR